MPEELDAGTTHVKLSFQVEDKITDHINFEETIWEKASGPDGRWKLNNREKLDNVKKFFNKILRNIINTSNKTLYYVPEAITLVLNSLRPDIKQQWLVKYPFLNNDKEIKILIRGKHTVFLDNYRNFSTDMHQVIYEQIGVEERNNVKAWHDIKDFFLWLDIVKCVATRLTNCRNIIIQDATPSLLKPPLVSQDEPALVPITIPHEVSPPLRASPPPPGPPVQQQTKNSAGHREGALETVRSPVASWSSARPNVPPPPEASPPIAPGMRAIILPLPENPAQTLLSHILFTNSYLSQLYESPFIATVLKEAMSKDSEMEQHHQALLATIAATTRSLRDCRTTAGNLVAPPEQLLTALLAAIKPFSKLKALLSECTKMAKIEIEHLTTQQTTIKQQIESRLAGLKLNYFLCAAKSWTENNLNNVDQLLEKEQTLLQNAATTWPAQAVLPNQIVGHVQKVQATLAMMEAHPFIIKNLKKSLGANRERDYDNLLNIVKITALKFTACENLLQQPQYNAYDLSAMIYDGIILLVALLDIVKKYATEVSLAFPESLLGGTFLDTTIPCLINHFYDQQMLIMEQSMESNMTSSNKHPRDDEQSAATPAQTRQRLEPNVTSSNERPRDDEEPAAASPPSPAAQRMDGTSMIPSL